MLEIALNYLPKQKVEYLSFKGNTTTPDGLKIPEYNEPIELWGSFQPVGATSKPYMGLNMADNYATFYVCYDVLTITRDKSTDRIRYNGKLYQAITETDWIAQSGWKSVLLVEIKDEG